MSAVAVRAPVHLPRAIALCGGSIVVAFLVQTAVLPAVGASAAIPLVFSTVVLLGLALGSRTGAVCGFLAGLLLDLTGVGVLGVGALLGTLLGAAAGRLRVDRWWLSGVPTAALMTILGALAYGGINAALAGLPVSLGRSPWWVVLGSLVSTLALLPLRGVVREAVR